MERIDKYLWAVRLFKTRSDAAEACRSGRVSVGGATAKPSREIRVGEIVSIRKPPVTYSYRVLAVVSSRVGAPLVAGLIEDCTPDSELAKLEAAALSDGHRDRGTGRPTKKDRRELEKIFE